MSQEASNPLNLTTMTNVADALNRMVRTSPDLKEALIVLRTRGMTPSELKFALGPLADNPQIMESLKLASGPDYMKSFDALDPAGSVALTSQVCHVAFLFQVARPPDAISLRVHKTDRRRKVLLLPQQSSDPCGSCASVQFQPGHCVRRGRI